MSNVSTVFVECTSLVAIPVADASTTWVAIGSVGTFLLAVSTLALGLVTRSVAAKTDKVASETRDVAKLTRDLGEQTRSLAAETRRLAEATEATATATRATVDAIEEPFVIAVPTPVEVFSQGSTQRLVHPGIHRAQAANGCQVVRLRLWNIGSGPTIVTGMKLTGHDGTECLARLPGGDRPIGPQQFADMEIESPAWPSVLGEGELVITYRHATGAEYQTQSLASIGEPTLACVSYERTRT